MFLAMLEFKCQEIFSALLSRLALVWIVGIALAHWLNLPGPVIAIARYLL
jgi:hypothetical protein